MGGKKGTKRSTLAKRVRNSMPTFLTSSTYWSLLLCCTPCERSMTARTTAVVASYTLSCVRSSRAVGVGSNFFTTTSRSSEEVLNSGVDVRPAPAPSISESVSDRSDRLAATDSLFFCKYQKPQNEGLFSTGSIHGFTK